jgi:hypothetical protein
MTVEQAMVSLASALEPMQPRRDSAFWKWDGDSEDFEAMDFIHSEDASARLLDAMPCARVENVGICWTVTYDLTKNFGLHGDAEHADRKTAVFLAALAWKQIPKPEGL